MVVERHLYLFHIVTTGLRPKAVSVVTSYSSLSSSFCSA